MQQNEQERGDLRETSGQPLPADEVEFVAVSDDETQQLRVAQRQAEEYLDLLRRTQADFVNYRRRMSQEQAETRLTAQIGLLNQLLPVLDDFERAVAVTPPDLAKDPWVQGLLLIARRLTALLNQLGIQPLGTPGEPFDPRLHEAITMEPCADAPEGSIVRVVRAGYALGDRIIRPAQVIVASAPSPVGGTSSS